MNMRALELYYTPSSAPCRAVMLTGRALKLNFNLKFLDLKKKEQMNPEFLKINFQHNVPTLNDRGFVMNESRAIMCYLADKFRKDDFLYPEKPQERAIVNQRLYFDLGTLYRRFSELYYPVIFGNEKSFDKEKKIKLDEALTFLNKYLEGTNPWVAGANMTIADLSIIATVSTIEALGYDLKPYPDVSKWLIMAKKAIPGYYEINQPGVDAFKDRAKHIPKL
uniref:Uncharacterized protein n=1 Tax=Clastoptera arizonana TaxID=38151 RepID=A0A1B6DCS8_9HEMI